MQFGECVYLRGGEPAGEPDGVCPPEGATGDDTSSAVFHRPSNPNRGSDSLCSGHDHGADVAAEALEVVQRPIDRPGVQRHRARDDPG